MNDRQRVRLARAYKMRQAIERDREVADGRMAQVIADLVADGVPAAAVARELGMSRQALHQRVRAGGAWER